MVRALALTLAQVSEEHVEEGDVDGAVGSSVVFDLAQHHLQPGHGEKGCREQAGTRRHTWRKNPAALGPPGALAEQGQRAKRGREPTPPGSLDSSAFQLQEHTPFPCHRLGFILSPSCEPTSVP